MSDPGTAEPQLGNFNLTIHPLHARRMHHKLGMKPRGGLVVPPSRRQGAGGPRINGTGATDHDFRFRKRQKTSTHHPDMSMPST